MPALRTVQGDAALPERLLGSGSLSEGQTLQWGDSQVINEPNACPTSPHGGNKQPRRLWKQPRRLCSLSPPVPPCLSLQASWASAWAGHSGEGEQIHTVVLGVSVRGSDICSSVAPLG